MEGWDKIVYFKAHEFDSPDKEGSGELMDYDFVAKLDKARELAKLPFRVTSGYRTRLHNKKIGGVSNSSHLRGYAADIAAVTDSRRMTVIRAAVLAGIPRIGVSSTFIHLDDDPTKHPALWLYPDTRSKISILLGNNEKPQDI